jgi:pyrroline-5-carboxylate reductase
MKKTRISFIGGGNMAHSLIGGLVKSGVLPSDILVSEPQQILREKLNSEFAVMTFAENLAVASQADVVVLAVKPQAMREAVASIKEALFTRPILLVSIAAGIRIASITRWVGGSPAIVRVMPNTPALIGSGISALYANERVDAEGKKVAQLILSAVGATVWLNGEDKLDAVTAVSGSGPAYFFYLMEAIEAAAIAQGLDPETARTLTIETALGASKLAKASNESVAALRKQVTSPGGTTEAALKRMQADSVFDSVVNAIAAAKTRSEELAAMLDTSSDKQ